MSMLQAVARFFSFADANVRYVALGSLLLGALGGLLGVFTLLKRRSLIGDALAHAALPGVCLAFLFSGNKSPGWLLAGAVATGLLAVFVLRLLEKNFPRIKTDAALGLVLTVFFGIGILLLTHISRGGDGGQSGLDKFLFGQAAGMLPVDVWWIGVFAACVSAILLIAFKEFTLVSFDAVFAESIGFRASILEVALLILTAIAIGIALQAVGVVLTAAILILPAASARLWVKRIPQMALLSTVIGGISGIAGAFVSFLAPRLPSGPLIVLTATAIFSLSLLFAPRRGILAKLWQHRANRRKIAKEHFLRTLWEELESQAATTTISLDALSHGRAWEHGELRVGCQIAKQEQLVTGNAGGVAFTAEGKAIAKKFVQKHRLWEYYLIEQANFPAAHVETDSDASEHFLPDEIVAELEVRYREQLAQEKLLQSPHPMGAKAQ
ncbi:MAG: metal ABC transporter permease [bacterium]|nr:metal ABC transporter permease [bacterium]